MSWIAKSTIALAMSVSAIVAVHAQGYPDRPIQLVVPFAPGGATDATARLVVPYVEKNMPANSRIIVVNKTGAGGEVGLRTVLQAKADGYTIGLFTVPNMLMKPHERDTDWNVNSLLPLANLVYDPAVIATRADAKFSNAKELIAEAKQNPGKITVGSTGIGSNDHLTFLGLEKAGGIKLRHIPFGGSAGSRTAVLGGHVDLYVTTMSDALGPIRERQIKPIGIVTKDRLSTAPEVPTLAEQGVNFQGAGGSSARGLIMHKDTPKEVVTLLAAAIDKALKDPEFIAKAEQMGLPLQYLGPADYGKYLQDSNKQLADLWKESPWLEKEAK